MKPFYFRYFNLILSFYVNDIACKGSVLRRNEKWSDCFFGLQYVEWIKYNSPFAKLERARTLYTQHWIEFLCIFFPLIISFIGSFTITAVCGHFFTLFFFSWFPFIRIHLMEKSNQSGMIFMYLCSQMCVSVVRVKKNLW